MAKRDTMNENDMIRPIAHRAALLAAAAALLLAPAARAHEYYTTDFKVIHPWTEPAPAGTARLVLSMKFVEIEADDRLVGARTEVADEVVLKTRSAASRGIVLKKGAEVSLSEAVDHLELRGVRVPLRFGRQYPLWLRFERAGEVPVDFVVGAH